jgi:hypothetical protein
MQRPRSLVFADCYGVLEASEDAIGDRVVDAGAGSPLLVRSRGGEVGIRTKIVPDLDSWVSAFLHCRTAPAGG